MEPLLSPASAPGRLSRFSSGRPARGRAGFSAQTIRAARTHRTPPALAAMVPRETVPRPGPLHVRGDPGPVRGAAGALAAAFSRLRIASVRAEARAGGTRGPVRPGPDGPGNVVRSGTRPGRADTRPVGDRLRGRPRIFGPGTWPGGAGRVLRRGRVRGRPGRGGPVHATPSRGARRTEPGDRPAGTDAGTGAAARAPAAGGAGAAARACRPLPRRRSPESPQAPELPPGEPGYEPPPPEVLTRVLDALRKL